MKAGSALAQMLDWAGEYAAENMGKALDRGDRCAKGHSQ
jgi:hypothetical protein